MKSGIYQIINISTARRYIGSSKDVNYRFRKHRQRLKSGTHANSSLQNAWNKYGEIDFKFELLLNCDINHLIFYEQRYMDDHRSYEKEFGYNIRKKAESNQGIKSGKLSHKKGDKYNRLTLISVSEKSVHGNHWLCLCDCGRETLANVSAVKYGKIKSCGCLKSEVIKSRRTHYSGEKYSRLTLIEYHGIDKNMLHNWVMECICKNRIVAPVSRVSKGYINSCGCLRSEKSRSHAIRINNIRGQNALAAMLGSG